MRLLNYSQWLNEADLPKHYTLEDKPQYGYRIDPEGKHWQWVDLTKGNFFNWNWVTNYSSVQKLNKKYGKNLLVKTDVDVQPITDPEKIKVINAIKDAGKALGWTDNAIAAVVGNVGRENGFNWEYLTGSHSDPRTGAKNFGIISWQGDRLKKVQQDLKASGLLQKDGSAVSDPRSIKVMIKFMNREMDQEGGNSQLMKDPNATTSQVSDMLKNYIKYAMGSFNSPDKKFNAKKNHLWAAAAKVSGLVDYA
jgi:hypothetical protein